MLNDDCSTGCSLISASICNGSSHISVKHVILSKPGQHADPRADAPFFSTFSLKHGAQRGGTIGAWKDWTENTSSQPILFVLKLGDQFHIIIPTDLRETIIIFTERIESGTKVNNHDFDHLLLDTSVGFEDLGGNDNVLLRVGIPLQDLLWKGRWSVALRVLPP